MGKIIFGVRLDQALMELKVEERELEKETGIPLTILRKWRAGKYTPRYKDIELVAKTLNINKLYLLGREVPLKKERASCKKW